jgi:hypothetical protein
VKNTSIRNLIAIALFSSTSTAAYSRPALNIQSVPMQQQVGEVVSHLVGVMDTSAQAQANPKAPNVRMTTCKVSVENTKKSPKVVFLY